MDTTQMRPEAERKQRPRQPEQRTAAPRPKPDDGVKNTTRAPAEKRKPPEPGKRLASQGKPVQKQGQAPRKPRPATDTRQGRKQWVKAEETGLFSRKPVKKQEQPQASKSERKRNTKAPQPEYTMGLPDSVSTKKRAYGQSKPKKKTVLDVIKDGVKRSGDRKVERIKKHQQTMEKGTAPRKTAPITRQGPVIIYNDPVAFHVGRFLMQMVTVAAVVMALVWGLSVFFKVETVTVSGAEVYSPWTVREASGIKEGDNLLSFSHARAGAQIKANLPYVKTVRFGIKLPDTVNIIIEEEDVLYAIQTDDGTWWLMSSSGRMVEQTNKSVASRYTQILGVTVTAPVVNERGVATESALVYETDGTGETVPVPVAETGAMRFNTALKIVKALEANDIVGDAASVDVSRLGDIILWYGTQYQVNLGDSSNIDYKIACMDDVILQMKEYQTGILDISFTIWPNQVGFTPFG